MSWLGNGWIKILTQTNLNTVMYNLPNIQRTGRVETYNMMFITRLVICTLLLLWLSGCENKPGQSLPAVDMPADKQTLTTADVEITLKQFIHASINRHHTDYYDLLSASDQAVKTKEEYLEEQSKLQPNLADEYFHEISYEITSLTLNGSECNAEVLYQYPDVERMIKQVYNLSVLNKSALPALDEMKQQINAAFEGKPLPMKTLTRHFKLKHENNQWRVSTGWDRQK